MKSLLKKSVSILLTLCLVFSMASTGVAAGLAAKQNAPVVAGIGGFFGELVGEKLIETGMRALCEGTEMLAEATGSEEFEEAVSFVNKWVLMDASEAAAVKTQELCQEILNKLDELEEEMGEYSSEIELLIGKSTYADSLTALNQQWANDVTNIMDAQYYSVSQPLAEYDTYMRMALQFANGENNVTQEDLDKQSEALIMSFASMYTGSISVEDRAPEKFKELIFAKDSCINDNFTNVLNNLSLRLVTSATASTNVAERAAILANNAFPFSHQQYEYVYTVIYEQFMTILQVEMLYNEFLALQGEYLKNNPNYGTDSPTWDGYLPMKESFMDQIKTITKRMTQMLETEMQISDSVSLTLDDYMKPEDAFSTAMRIDGYNSSIIIETYRNTSESEAVYSKEYTQFHRVMANDTVYYIMDPNQFSDSKSMSASTLDYKIDRTFDYDIHYPSCDYDNYIRNMSDGANTYKATDSTTEYRDLYNTNAFSLAERVPTKYLKDYMPAKNSNRTTYLITDHWVEPVEIDLATMYADIYLINGDAPAAGNAPVSEKTSNEDFQAPGGNDDRFSVILANQSGVYRQNVRLKTNGAPVDDMKITTTDADGNEITVTGSETALIPSGQMISISFKLHDGYTLDTLKVLRDKDVFHISDDDIIETVLLSGSLDYDMMTIDEDGYCTFEYPMPYSDVTFELSAMPGGDYEDSIYYISNAEQLMAFAEYVNRGFVKTDAIVTADIDMSDYKWTPIAVSSEHPYEGVFDGGGHTISNLHSIQSHSNSGFFGTSKGTVKNISVTGEFVFYGPAISVGGVVGNAIGGAILNVSSGISIVTQDNPVYIHNHIGGVVGTAQNVTIDRCAYTGHIDISCCYDCFGCVVGYAGGNVTISNCANLGNIITRQSGAYTGGILGYLNNTSTSVINCYNYGYVECIYVDYFYNDQSSYSGCGAIIGKVKHADPNKISNNYYKDTTPLAFGKDCTLDLTAQKMTKAQFASGEVAYRLNKGVTSGTQVWYQNLDNGQPADAYPVFSGGTVYYGLDCTGSAVYSNYDTSGGASHRFDAEGFCTVCGDYQPAVLNGVGVYEISNAGQLFWFAALVNGDSTHAEFEKKQADASAVLMKDIDLGSHDWTPINNYAGIFDGANRTIANMNIPSAASKSGLFGLVSGTVKNVTVKGSITVAQSADHIGGIVGYLSFGTISNCTSYVDLSTAEGDTTSVVNHLGGVLGSFYGGLVENCLSYSKISLNEASADCLGGVVGYAGVHDAALTNCAYFGVIQTRNSNAFTGGVLGYLNDSDVYVTNCYNYGTVSCSSNGQESTLHCGAIIGWLRSASKSKIYNNYYNSETCPRPFGTEGAAGFTAQAMTAQQFLSGEVAYKLNNGITDGTQVWYQNLDNGGTNYGYPLFDGGTVYELPDGAYSNTDRSADAFDRDENGDLLIKTYEDLVKLAELMRSDYDLYGSESYALANNIFAPADSVWSMGIGSVAENKPFNGSFHGNAHIIAGLNIACDTYGGLFEIIGQSGSVDDLFLVDCDYADGACTYAGGIAAVNEGTISGCMSGLLLSGEIVFTNPNTQEQITAKDYNSTIRGVNAGGVAAINHGRIEFTRNASVVTGTENVGGIAAVNEGSIYGCSNNAPIGDTTAKVSGGLVGTNNGALESGYSSGKVKGKSSGSFGAVAGVNNSEEVHNIFYVVINSVDALGKSSTVPLGSDNIQKSGSAAMREDDFTAELNAVTEGREWVRDDYHNQGFPAIDSKYFDIQFKQSANGITVSGVMHQSLQISYQLCGQNSQIYQQLSQHATGKLFAVYAAQVTDGTCVDIPFELWSRGGVQITLPSDRIIAVTGITADGSIVKLETRTEGGKTLFSAEEPFAYLVVSEQADDSENAGTGDESYVSLAALIALTAVFGMALLFILEKRSRKFETS